MILLFWLLVFFVIGRTVLYLIQAVRWLFRPRIKASPYIVQVVEEQQDVIVLP